jgi:hypothetical protein
MIDADNWVYWKGCYSDGPLQNDGRGQSALRPLKSRVLARVLKFRVRIFPSVFE